VLARRSSLPRGGGGRGGYERSTQKEGRRAIERAFILPRPSDTPLAFLLNSPAGATGGKAAATKKRRRSMQPKAAGAFNVDSTSPVFSSTQQMACQSELKEADAAAAAAVAGSETDGGARKRRRVNTPAGGGGGPTPRKTPGSAGAIPFLGDAASSLGDAKSSLGDAKSSLGDVYSAQEPGATAAAADAGERAGHTHPHRIVHRPPAAGAAVGSTSTHPLALGVGGSPHPNHQGGQQGGWVSHTALCVTQRWTLCALV
jgi:hypothetical protein